jgi:thioesterase domain-containing protein
MTTTTTKQKKPPTKAATFEEIAERKYRQTLEEYRGLVERAAGGEQLRADDLDRAVELLALLRMPELAWAQHVAAVRDYRQAVARVAELEQRQRDAVAEAEQLVRDIEALEDTLREKRNRVQLLSGTYRYVTEAYRRQNELEQLYPDVVLSLDNAVAARHARSATKTTTSAAEGGTTTEPDTGWSTT